MFKAGPTVVTQIFLTFSQLFSIQCFSIQCFMWILKSSLNFVVSCAGTSIIIYAQYLVIDHEFLFGKDGWGKFLTCSETILGPQIDAENKCSWYVASTFQCSRSLRYCSGEYAPNFISPATQRFPPLEIAAHCKVSKLESSTKLRDNQNVRIYDFLEDELVIFQIEFTMACSCLPVVFRHFSVMRRSQYLISLSVLGTKTPFKAGFTPCTILNTIILFWMHQEGCNKAHQEDNGFVPFAV